MKQDGYSVYFDGIIARISKILATSCIGHAIKLILLKTPLSAGFKQYSYAVQMEFKSRGIGIFSKKPYICV